MFDSVFFPFRWFVRMSYIYIYIYIWKNLGSALALDWEFGTDIIKFFKIEYCDNGYMRQTGFDVGWAVAPFVHRWRSIINKMHTFRRFDHKLHRIVVPHRRKQFYSFTIFPFPNLFRRAASTIGWNTIVCTTKHSAHRTIRSTVTKIFCMHKYFPVAERRAPNKSKCWTPSMYKISKMMVLLCSKKSKNHFLNEIWLARRH